MLKKRFRIFVSLSKRLLKPKSFFFRSYKLLTSFNFQNSTLITMIKAFVQLTSFIYRNDFLNRIRFFRSRNFRTRKRVVVSGFAVAHVERNVARLAAAMIQTGQISLSMNMALHIITFDKIRTLAELQILA